MIREQISQTLKDAMQAKDGAKTTTLRMINAAIKQKDIDVARARGDQQISDDEILNLLQGLIKSRRESIDLYRQGERQDLVDKEAGEIAIIEQFLPKQMSEDGNPGRRARACIYPWRKQRQGHGQGHGRAQVELRRTARHDESERHREGGSFRLVSPAAQPSVDADEPALHPMLASMLHKLGHSGDDLDQHEKLLS